MTCPPHDWAEIPPRIDDHGNYVDTIRVAGKKCTRCPKLMGRTRGIISRESRNVSPLKGEVPEWLASLAEGAEWRPRLPASRERRADVEALVRAGVVNADFRAHEKTGEVVVVVVYLARPPSETRLPRLRRELAASVPTAKEWLNAARIEDLETAVRITQIPDFRGRRWTTRIWNAATRDGSKKGDVARIAKELGCAIMERASTHAVWFYGHGIVRTPEREIRVEGEIVVPDAWLRGDVTISERELGVVENRELASLAPGLVMALDGQPTPTQLHVMKSLATGGVGVWFWPDVDGAGVNMARAIQRTHPLARVVGLQPWPREWARQQEPDQRLQTIDASRIIDEWTPVLEYIKKVGWVEQERVYAELDARGDPWRLLFEKTLLTLMHRT